MNTPIPSPTDDLELTEILVNMMVCTAKCYRGELCGECRRRVDYAKAALTAREARKVAEVEKAYGGCHNCQLCEVHRDGME